MRSHIISPSLFLLTFLTITFLAIATSDASDQIEPHPTEAKVLLVGNWPDPSILKDGDDYYMTHSNWNFQPDMLIWHSKDLKTWRPITRVTINHPYPIWAPDLVKHGDTYYIYIPSKGNWVTTAKDIRGPWSKPVKLDISGIDPGHVADEKGHRYLYVSGGYAAPLSEDGLKITGPKKRVYQGWAFPKEWITEGFCLESPKFTKHGNWYYMTSAQGGTAGPSTSHMIVSARSRTPLGPWENSPHNPILRTWDRSEPFWSKGHGTLVEGPKGNWFCVCHGYPNALRSLGRYTLIEPIEWTKDGWFKVADKWPAGWNDSIRVEMPMSDNFDGKELGIQWQFYAKLDPKRFRFKEGAIEIDGQGNEPGESSPLCVMPIHESYSIETEVEIEGDATAGLMLFYRPFAYLGMKLEPDGTVRRFSKNIRSYGDHRNTKEGRRRITFKIVNDRQDVQFFYKEPTGDWTPLSTSVDVAHVNHNAIGGWGALRPALFVTGKGKARFLYFKYEPLDKKK